MLDIWLVMALGFLGSFGHCVGMCGPITVAFSLSQPQASAPTAADRDADQDRWQQLRFHILLNLGRISSYMLVGAAIGGLGSVLIAGGQVAGVGSLLRRMMALLTGGLLIWLGLNQVIPGLLPPIPLLNPMAQGKLHNRLSSAMVKLSLQPRWWTPVLLGMAWGLIPCGFLYVAQIRAAETGQLWGGAAIMLAFGLGTLPAMVGIGAATSMMGGDRRSQLFRLGGWITLAIGLLTLLRTGDTMVDYTGHAALIGLILALLARPISRIWPQPLRYRRALGVGAFVLAIAHTIHMVEHSWGWNLEAVAFMLPQHQIGIAAGAAALLCLVPAALTSFDQAQRYLGAAWRRLHLLTLPALLLSAAHCILIGSRYLGPIYITWRNWAMVAALGLMVLLVLLLRSPWVWAYFHRETSYVAPPSSKPVPK